VSLPLTLVHVIGSEVLEVGGLEATSCLSFCFTTLSVNAKINFGCVKSLRIHVSFSFCCCYCYYYSIVNPTFMNAIGKNKCFINYCWKFKLGMSIVILRTTKSVDMTVL
jgi:hypothetical protein